MGIQFPNRQCRNVRLQLVEEGSEKYLGELKGYSRPIIASENDTALIPKHSDSDQAVSFTVGQLR